MMHILKGLRDCCTVPVIIEHVYGIDVIFNYVIALPVFTYASALYRFQCFRFKNIHVYTYTYSNMQ